jgi:cAMP phosphodiesterase
MSAKLQELYIKTKSELSKCLISDDFSAITLGLSETSFAAINKLVDTVCLDMQMTSEHIERMDATLTLGNNQLDDVQIGTSRALEVRDTLMDQLLDTLPQEPERLVQRSMALA